MDPKKAVELAKNKRVVDAFNKAVKDIHAMTRQELTEQIDKIYAEVNWLNEKYRGKRLTAGQVQNIQRLKWKASDLIELRKNLPNETRVQDRELGDS
jgi:hypothetical protein